MKEKSLDRLRKSIVTFELDRESRRWNYYCDFRETSNCEKIRLTEEKKKKKPTDKRRDCSPDAVFTTAWIYMTEVFCKCGRIAVERTF